MPLTKVGNFSGHAYELGSEVFLVKPGHLMGSVVAGYLKVYPNARFRLIVPPGQTVMGYNDHVGWVTVCPEEAPHAKFMGVPKASLVAVKQEMRFNLTLTQRQRDALTRALELFSFLRNWDVTRLRTRVVPYVWWTWNGVRNDLLRSLEAFFEMLPLPYPTPELFDSAKATVARIQALLAGGLQQVCQEELYTLIEALDVCTRIGLCQFEEIFQIAHGQAVMLPTDKSKHTQVVDALKMAFQLFPNASFSISDPNLSEEVRIVHDLLCVVRKNYALGVMTGISTLSPTYETWTQPVEPVGPEPLAEITIVHVDALVQDDDDSHPS